MRTYEEISSDLKSMQELFNPIFEQYREASKVISDLEHELEECVLANGMYRPMSDLKEYAGKAVNSIKLVIKNKNGSIETEDMVCNETFGVTEDGRLYYSSYHYGVMDFDEERNMYVYAYYGSCTYKNFVGFLEISVSDYEWF